MKWLVTMLFFIYSSTSSAQELVELGVKFSLKDTVLSIKLLDGKYKHIKVVESKPDPFLEFEIIKDYYFEGDVEHDHKLHLNYGVIIIEIISGNKKKKFKFIRNKPSN
jgi:hypothetical protein